MRNRLHTLLIVLAASAQRLARRLLGRRWLTFSLRGMFVVITLMAIWLGIHVNWLRQRQEARRWIEEHETSGQWSRINPADVTVTTMGRPPQRGKAAEAPWGLRLLGETRLAYIHLDKSKLREADIPRIESLPALFPEAQQVQVEEPGWMHCWPPVDPRAFLKYPSRLVGGRIVNQPVDAAKSDPK